MSEGVNTPSRDSVNKGSVSIRDLTIWQRQWLLVTVVAERVVL